MGSLSQPSMVGWFVLFCFLAFLNYFTYTNETDFKITETLRGKNQWQSQKEQTSTSLTAHVLLSWMLYGNEGAFFLCVPTSCTTI